MKWILPQCAALLFILTTTAQANDVTDKGDMPDVKHFSRLPEFTRPALSPNGDRVAFVHNLSEPEGIGLLSTIDLTTRQRHNLLKSDYEKVKINWFRWANNDTLVISARYESQRRGTKFFQTRLYSMPFNEIEDGPTNIIKPRSTTTSDNPRNSQLQDNVIDWLPDDPDHIMVAVDLERPNLPSVYKVNIHTGKLSRIVKGKLQIRDWMTDQQGILRLGISLSYESGERNIYHRFNEDEDWEVLFSYNVMTDPDIIPSGFGLDPNILYYKANKGDFRALFKKNLKTGEVTEVLADDNYDVDGSLIYSTATRDVIGVRHGEAETGRVYWDERYVALQRGLDAVMPDWDNYLVSFDDTENRYIMYSENDHTPGSYFIGDRKAKSLDLLFSQYRELSGYKFPAHDLVTYEARDGLEIEGYLTVPEGEGPFPTIIHPHGGPGARDYDGFDTWTSYFVSRGYAVFRPNFRGSTGYGFEFSQAQMKGWGLAMQDDVTDGTQWLVQQGIADPDKMCIVGASYGGYAALMATVKTPDLFKCAVSFAGVSDLRKLVSQYRRFLNKGFVENQIGDDSDDLKNRSAYYHVEKIKTPILLIHGDEDRSVNVRQSRIMAEELDDHDKVYRYVELEAGDHHLSIQRNRHTFFAEMDAFLTQYLN